ncbi:hypothetical protein FBUS_02613 [Fasciolopsis buskii]|uniref:Uncharacterized protein n=1 Tax=Fasciolopsis buskii TaxID=27845 RepID=A0A8E0RK11_9TREM|nr:hypothetical protein FBUS_02613 [Fasciolopsis buski]
MGHSNSRLPIILNDKVLAMIQQQCEENHIPSTEFSPSDLRSLQRKIKRRVLRYLKSTYAPEQLAQLDCPNAAVPILTTNQQQTLHAIVRDSVVCFTQSRNRSPFRSHSLGREPLYPNRVAPSARPEIRANQTGVGIVIIGLVI